MRRILSEELGIGEKTISNTIKEYREDKTVTSPNKRRKCRNITNKTDDFDKEAIRRKIHQFWLRRELPTLKKILMEVNEDDSLPDFTRSSFHVLLKSMDLLKAFKK